MEIQETTRSATGVRVVSPKVPPRTLSHRDYSTPSLKLNPFLRLMLPLGHLKQDVLFVPSLILYHMCTNIFHYAQVVTLTFLKMPLSITTFTLIVYSCMEMTLTDSSCV